MYFKAKNNKFDPVPLKCVSHWRTNDTNNHRFDALYTVINTGIQSIGLAI